MKHLTRIFALALTTYIAVSCAIGTNVVVNGQPTWGARK